MISFGREYILDCGKDSLNSLRCDGGNTFCLNIQFTSSFITFFPLHLIFLPYISTFLPVEIKLPPPTWDSPTENSEHNMEIVLIKIVRCQISLGSNNIRHENCLFVVIPMDEHHRIKIRNTINHQGSLRKIIPNTPYWYKLALLLPKVQSLPDIGWQMNSNV